MEVSFLDQLYSEWGVSEAVFRAVLIVLTLVFLTGIISFIAGKVLVKIEVQVEKTQNLWDDTLLHAANKPVKFFIWVIGLSLAAEVTQSYFGKDFFQFFDPLRKIGVIYSLCWFLVRFVSGAEKVVVAPDKMKQPMDQTTVSAIAKLSRASVVIIGILVALQTFGFSVSGVLAFGGIGGIAVGFAAKDLLANFFGGLMVYLDRPFSVGDWVRSPDQNIEGTVENIGWRTTRIRTFDKRPIYVPNSTFTNITVENPSRMSHRRIYETIGVRYEDGLKVESILVKVKAMLLAHDGIDTSQTLMVNFNAFNASSLDFFIYTFTKTTNWIKFHEVKQDILLKVMTIIDEEGAEIAFPTRTLHHVGAPVLPPTTESSEFNGLSDKTSGGIE